MRLHELLALWRRQGFDPAYRTLLLAVSGGADSVALLRFFADEVRPFTACRLRVLHVHHGLRPENEAGGDADFVAALGSRLGVPCDIVRLAAARGRRESTEAWARRERYAALHAAAERHHAAYILTAHHRDDWCETVALRLCRGEGWPSLLGMPFLRPPGIVRPFLHLPGDTLRAYLRALGQPWRHDATNDDPRHLRNRLRRQTLPWDTAAISPAASAATATLAADEATPRARLFALGQTLRTLQPWLDQLETLAPESPTPENPQPHWPEAALLEPLRQGDAPLVLARLRALLTAAGGPPGWPKKTFLRPLSAFFQDSTAAPMKRSQAWPMASGWRLQWAEGIFRAVQTASACKEARVEIILNALPNRWEFELADARYRLSVSPLPHGLPADFPTRQEGRVVCDAQSFSSTLLIRTRQAGDRFCPLGLRSRSRKLKTFLNEQRVPVGKRNTLPLIFSHDTLVWVPGYGLSEWFKVKPETKLLYEMVLECLTMTKT